MLDATFCGGESIEFVGHDWYWIKCTFWGFIGLCIEIFICSYHQKVKYVRSEVVYFVEVQTEKYISQIKTTIL